MINIKLNFKNVPEGINNIEPMDLNLENNSTLTSVLEEVAKKLQIIPEKLLLMYSGSVLNLEDTVEGAGVNSGDYIQCLIGIQDSTPISTSAVKPADCQGIQAQLLKHLKSKSNNSFFMHIQKPEFTQKLATKVPEFHEDPTALFIVQDPSVLTCYVKDTTEAFETLLSKRPVLYKILKSALDMYQSDCNDKTVSTPSHTSGHSYTIDSLHEHDEEDEMMMRRGGASTSSGNRGANSSSSLPMITPAQVAAALAQVSGEMPGIGPSHTPSITVPQNRGGAQLASIPATPSNTPASLTSNTPNTPSSHTSNTPSASHTPHTPQTAGGTALPPITSEMLNNALQNVFGSAVGPANSSAPAPIAPSVTPPAPPNMEEAVRLMAEMGIPDEALSRQALQMTNGDVQAAVELVFAQMNMFD